MPVRLIGQRASHEFLYDHAIATLDGGKTAEVRLKRQDGNANSAEPPASSSRAWPTTSCAAGTAWPIRS